MENANNQKYSSDSDIITETPPRLVKKKPKKALKSRTRTRLKPTHHYEDYLPDLKCFPEPNCSLEMTRSGSVNQNKPYVYRTIDEILEFKENCPPRNNNMHLVGVHKFSHRLGHYLTNKVDDDSGTSFIQLDFKFVAKVPDEGEFISVYGSLENKTGCHKNLIFVVRFYREEAAGMVNRYKECLKFLRNYVPTSYLATINSKQ